MNPIYQSARIDYDKVWGIAGFLFPIATLLHIQACFTKTFSDTDPALEPPSLIGRVRPATVWQHLARAIIFTIPLLGSLLLLIYDAYADLYIQNLLMAHTANLESNLNQWIQEEPAIENKEVIQGSDASPDNNPLPDLNQFSSQLELDLNRGLSTRVASYEGEKRFFVDHQLGLPLHEQIQQAEEDAKQAVADLVQYVTQLPHLTTREQWIILDYSSQTMFNHSAVVFEKQCWLKLQELLHTIAPDGNFLPFFQDYSEIVHDVENKKTTAFQTVRIADINQIQDSRNPPSVLQLRVHSSLDWNTEQLSLDAIDILHN